MQLSIHSWSSTDLTATTDINNGTDFAAWYDGRQITVPERKGIYTPRSNSFQKLSGVVVNQNDFTFNIRCLGTIHSQRETIKRYFSPESYAIGSLEFLDAANGKKAWYISGMPTRIVEESPGVLAITLSLDEPYLRSSTDNATTMSVTASGQSTDVTVDGNLNAHPVLTITPTVGKGSYYQYKRWVAIYNPSNKVFTNYPFDFGGIDTAALVLAGKMQSAGQDFRLKVNGVEIPRWFGTTDGRGINTTDTAVWASINLAPATDLYLKTSIGSTETEWEIDIDATDTAAIMRAHDAANKCLLIEGEAVTYNRIVYYAGVGKVLDIQRGAKGTTAASHAAGVAAHHIQFDSWLLYGDTDAATPSAPTATKPIIDLHSTNTTWYYSNYYAPGSAGRGGQFTPLYVSAGAGRQSTIYTANHATNANPASEMGASLRPFQYLGAWKSDTANLVWQLNHPAGITAVNVTGEKYRYSTGWATTAGLNYFNGSTGTWITLTNLATPASAQTWTAFTIASTEAGLLPITSYNIRFVLQGMVTGSVGNQINIEFDEVTLTLDSNGIPVKSISSEQTSYTLNATITNTTTGEYIDLDWPMGLNRTLTVDCDAKTVTYDDGTNAYGAIKLSAIRNNWLDLKPGSNTIKYTEPGAVGVTFGITWQDRNTL